jgi:hypothetical protein
MLRPPEAELHRLGRHGRRSASARRGDVDRWVVAWIFPVNLPLGLIAPLAGWRVLPRDGAAHRPPPDVGGLMLVMLLTAAVLVGGVALGPRSVAGAAVDGAVAWLCLRRSRDHEHAVLRPQRVAVPRDAAAPRMPTGQETGAGPVRCRPKGPAPRGVRLWRLLTIRGWLGPLGRRFR